MVGGGLLLLFAPSLLLPPVLPPFEVFFLCLLFTVLSTVDNNASAIIISTLSPTDCCETSNRFISVCNLDKINGSRYSRVRYSGLVCVKCDGRESLDERTL